MSRYLGALRRGTFVASFLFQSIIIFIAAAIIEGGAVNGSLATLTNDIEWRTELPIALLSFQSAGQISSSRILNLSEIPTVVLTSMMFDIFSDTKLISPLTKNVKRNRRVIAFLCILVGAVASGFIAQGTGRIQIPLWIAAGIKTVVTIAWMIWPEKKANAA